MQKFSFYVIVMAALFFTACNSDSAFLKSKQGLEYKIISNGRGKIIKPGEYMQIHVSQFYATGKSDSMLSDTRNTSGPIMEKIDSASMPPAYYEILSQLRKDDSLIIRMTTDSAFAKAPGGMPPFFKKGHYLTTRVKVVNILADSDAADSARLAERKLAIARDSIMSAEMKIKDDKTIKDYLAKNKINTTRTAEGTYVEIIQPGTGPNIDTTVSVSVNYTGRTINGKMFDSNTDPSKNHAEPLLVNLTSERDRALGTPVIKGWADGFKLLNKGAKARLYIPSPLGYGTHAVSDDLPANSILIFDVEILDILTKDQAKAAFKEKMDSIKLKQKAYTDSIKKINQVKTDSSKKAKTGK